MFLTIRLSPTNCFLIKIPVGYLLIDTSFPSQFGEFTEQLKKNNIDPSEIKYLLLTHHHDDHAGFAAALKELTNCTLIVHEKAIPALRDGILISKNKPLNLRVKATMAIYNIIKRRNFKIAPVKMGNKDIIISKDDDTLLWNIGIEGKIIRTPGHTVDSISVILSNGDAFVGDVCMNFLNFCGIHYRPIWLYDQNIVFDSWQKIIENGAKTIYPAHGKPFQVEELILYLKANRIRNKLDNR
jgi:glyoxylase-like metal-dependent hydrolase (beta-lactamase superfamily II)